jgi:two-component system, sensor histidine kinase and response regulator
LIDFDMPEMDGMALVEEMHRRYLGSAPRAVLLSPAGLIGVREAGRLFPIAGKLTKPALPFEITEALTKAITPSSSLSAAPKHAGAPVRPSALREGFRVLLAEDNRINQEVARRLLEKRGCRVVIASDGLEAVEAFANQVFDAVLMDVQMPGLGGLEATARIRAHEAGTSRTPVIALTANAMAGDRERCLAADMDGFLSKPVRAADLFAELDRVSSPERFAR